MSLGDGPKAIMEDSSGPSSLAIMSMGNLLMYIIQVADSQKNK